MVEEILRRSAESVMHRLVRTVCSRLHVLDPVTEEAKLSSNGYDVVEQEGGMSISNNSIAEVADESGVSGSQSAETLAQQEPLEPQAQVQREQCERSSIMIAPHNWMSLNYIKTGLRQSLSCCVW